MGVQSQIEDNLQFGARGWKGVQVWIPHVSGLLQPPCRQSTCPTGSQIPPSTQVAPTWSSCVPLLATEPKILCQLCWWGCGGPVKTTGCSCAPGAYKQINFAEVYHTGMPSICRWHVKKDFTGRAGRARVIVKLVDVCNAQPVSKHVVFVLEVW